MKGKLIREGCEQYEKQGSRRSIIAVTRLVELHHKDDYKCVTLLLFFWSTMFFIQE